MDLYYREITIDYTKVGAALTNFPIYVSINLGANVADTNGYDVHFKNAGGEELPFELISWDNIAKVWNGWVRIDSISNTANTVFRAYYGNATISTNQSSTTTWDASFKQVYHLEESSGAPQDSTSNAQHLAVRNGAATYGVTGVNGRGYTFNGSTDFQKATGAYDPGAGAFTASAWVKTTQNLTYAGFMGHIDGGPTTGWTLEVSATNPVIWFNNTTITASTNVANNAWRYLSMTRDNSGNVVIYVDGVSAATGTNTSNLTTSSPFYLGSWGNMTYAYSGSLDEVRVASSARSAGWVLTEYNNQSNPATFSAMGAEMALGVNDITFVGSNSNHTGSTNSTTLSVAKPTGTTTNDLLVVSATMVEGTRTTADFADLDGWTLINSLSTTSPNRVRQSVWYKFAENADPGNITVQAVTGSGCKIVVTVSAYRYVDLTTPIMAFAGRSNTSTSTSVPFNAVTATAPGYLIAFGGGRGSGAHSADLNTSTYTLDSAARTTASSYMYTFGAHGESVTSGSVTPPTMTYAANMTQTMTHAIILTALSSPTTGNGLIKVWNGSSWVRKPVKVWNGTSWVQKPVKVWDGANWVTTNPSGPPVMPP